MVGRDGPAHAFACEIQRSECSCTDEKPHESGMAPMMEFDLGAQASRAFAVSLLQQ